MSNDFTSSVVNLSSRLQSLLRSEKTTGQEFIQKLEDVQTSLNAVRRVIESIPGGQHSPSEQNNKIEQLQHEICVKTELIAKYKALGTSVLDPTRTKQSPTSSKNQNISTNNGGNGEQQYPDNDSE